MNGNQHYEEGEHLLESIKEEGREWKPGEKFFTVEVAHAHFTAAIAAAHLGRDRDVLTFEPTTPSPVTAGRVAPRNN